MIQAEAKKIDFVRLVNFQEHQNNFPASNSRKTPAGKCS